MIGIENKMFGKVEDNPQIVLVPTLLIKPHTPYSVVR